MRMKLTKADWSGTGSVYRFTLWQVFKSRANIITAVLMIVLSLLSFPMMQLFSGAQTTQNVVQAPQIEASGLTSAQMQILQSGLVIDWNHAQATTGMGNFWVQYAYSVIVLLLCVITSTYIVRAIVEEKSTKLVELLTVSVSPLALILGKVLADMTYVFALVLAMIGSMALSGVATSLLWEGPSVQATLAALGIATDEWTLSPLTVVAFLVSVLLSYLTVSFLSALSGAACSQVEEADAANTTAMLFVLSGYLLSAVLIAFDGAGAVWFSVLCPGISAFAAPIRYLLGDVPFWALMLSWVLQAGVLWLLLRLSAKVYRDMIYYQGKRLKWKEIFRMARQSKGKEEA